MQCQVWVQSEPFGNEAAMWLQDALAVTTHLAWTNRSGCTMALRPLHHLRRGHIKVRCNGTDAFAAQHCGDNTFTKII